MKKKVLKILSIGMVGVAAITMNVTPVLATSDTDSGIEVVAENETEELDVAPELDPSVLTIEAYNKDRGSYLSSASFEIKQGGSLVSFSKISSEEYEVDDTGRYKYIELYDGSVKIKGLNGSYTINDVSSDSDLKCDTGSQNISINPEDTKTITFEYSANYGTLKVSFHGEDDSAISNAVFTVKNSNGGLVYFAESNGIYEYNTNSTMSEISTNSSGLAILHVPAGSYTIAQTSSPVEYNGALASKVISVNNQEEVSVSLVNTKEYGNLMITVVDSADDNIKLTGAEFTITASNNDNVYVVKNGDGSYSYSRTSGDNILISNDGSIALNDIPEGSYIISQRAGAEGYEISDEKQFDIKADNTSTISFKNSRSVGTLRISINDEESGEPIKGFTYSLLTKDGEQPLKFKMTATGYSYDENGSEEVQTDENGEIILEKIPTGSYYLSQVKAVPGYLLDVDDTEQVINSGEETIYSTKASKSNSAIVIVDTDGNAVASVSFEIIDIDGNKVVEDKTGEDGKYLISGIESGDYKLNITGVPETYSMYKKTMEFSLDSTGMAEGLGRITLDFTKVTLNLGKKDIEVELTSSVDGSSITVKTDDSGVATFTKLTYGEYTLKLVDDTISFTPITFVVDEEFSAVAYNVDLIANEDASDDIEDNTSAEAPVAKKKINSGAIILIIALIVAACAGVYAYIFYKKKRDEKMAEIADDSIKVGFDENGNAVFFEEVEVDNDEYEETEKSEDKSEIESEEISEDYGLEADKSDTITKEEQD